MVGSCIPVASPSNPIVSSHNPMVTPHNSMVKLFYYRGGPINYLSFEQQTSPGIQAFSLISQVC